MKARTIRRLRKKISKKGYYEDRWEMFAEKCKQWKRFERWECNSFFVGYEAAERNRWIYNTEGKRDMAKCDYYRRKVTREQ